MDAKRAHSELVKNPANHVPLSPVSFLERSATIWPNRVAVRHGPLAYTYREFEARCRRLASALARRGVGRGDTVAVMAANMPALLEAHYAVPALGAVLNALNTRLDARMIAFCLDHGEARVLITDTEFAPTIRAALGATQRTLLVVDIDDAEGPGGERLGELTYEALLNEGDPAFPWPGPLDEWDSLSLLYTSGTTGDPKGVVYHHRGAYLNALGNALAFRLDSDSVYLWTLPMFHCNGWTYTWAVTAAGGTHVCLRRVEPARIFAAIREHRVTHMCGAPIVLNMLIHAPDDAKVRFDHRVDVATGGAAPPSAVIESMEAMGFRVMHLYGLTESYGPATLCAWQSEWDRLPAAERAQRMARQGVAMPTLANLQVGNSETAAALPRDGSTLGEVMLRGNTIMKGYFKNAAASRQLHRDQGPSEGHHHHRRRKRQLARDRGLLVSSSADHGSGGCRASASALGRNAMRVRDAQKRRSGPRRERYHRVVPRASRAFQGADDRCIRAAAEDRYRQDPEVPAARARTRARRLGNL
jgi:fatty-acyl-CoA synthase